MMTHGRSDVSWTRLSEIIGSGPLGYEHGLIDALVND